MMSAKWILAALLLTAGGCVTLTEFGLDGGDCTTDGGDMTIPLPDLSLPAAKCAAAKGLSGDNLLCVDFDKVTQLTDAALAGWKFDVATPCPGWQINGGVLQIQNFGSFVGSCGLTLPSIDLKQADKQKYQRVTLAIVHKVDMSDIDQQAQIFIDLDSPARLIHQTTAKPGISTLTTTVLTINKADLPMSLMSVYKFFLKAGSLSAVGGRQGWQIQSIAVMGNL